jgi:hypothetical protein
VLDVRSGWVCQQPSCRVGRNLHISGGRLKIAGKDTSVGVCLHGSGGITVKVGPTDIVINNTPELMVVIPSGGNEFDLHA